MTAVVILAICGAGLGSFALILIGAILIEKSLNLFVESENEDITKGN